MIREIVGGSLFGSGFAELLHVGKILKSPNSKLVLNQVLPQDHVRRSIAVEEFHDAAFPRFIEGNPSNSLQNGTRKNPLPRAGRC